MRPEGQRDQYSRERARVRQQHSGRSRGQQQCTKIKKGRRSGSRRTPTKRQQERSHVAAVWISARRRAAERSVTSHELAKSR